MTEYEPMPLEALGRMHFEFNEIEFLLHITAWFLLGELEPHSIGQAVTKKLSFYEITILISELIKAGNQPKEVTDLIAEIIPEARELSTQRNYWAHSILVGTVDDSWADNIRKLISGRESMFRFNEAELLAHVERCVELRTNKIYSVNRILDSALLDARPNSTESAQS